MSTRTDTGNTPEYPGQYAAPTDSSGNGVAIAGLALALLPIANIVGLILSIIGLRAARRENRSQAIGIIGVVVSSMTILGSLIATVVLIVVLSFTVAQCAALGPGTHYVDGVNYTCS